MLSAFARARAPLVFARGLASVARMFFIKRAGGDFVELSVDAAVSVAALKEAAAAKLRIDAPLDAVSLSRALGGGPLDARLSLDVSGLAERDELLLTVRTLRAATPDEAAADARVAAFCAALRAAEAVPIDGSASGAALVTLPADVEWPQLGTAPLFVRPFYAGCYESVLRECTAAVGDEPLLSNRFAIVGNAGIGKSAFGSYLLWRLVQARRTVVYVSDKVQNPFIVHANGQVESCTRIKFEERTNAILNSASTVLICDGVVPPIVSAFTVLITSPRRERWKIFCQMGARRLFFPVLSRAEIADMLRSCFPRLLAGGAGSFGGADGVWARFEMWGGIARYVLGQLDDDDQRLLENAATRGQIVELFDNLGAREIESHTVASHRFVHLKPVGENANGTFSNPHDRASYALACSELGSPYIKELVYRALEAADFDRVNAIVARAPTPAFSKLYNDLYERAAIDALVTGGSFARFDLTEGRDAGKLEVPPSDKVFFCRHRGTR